MSEPPASAGGCSFIRFDFVSLANTGDLTKHSGRHQRSHVNIVLPYLAVESRAIDTEEIRRGLLVTAGALQSLLDYQPLDIFQGHVRRHIPAGSCRRAFRQRAIIEWEIDGLNATPFGH